LPARAALGEIGRTVDLVPDWPPDAVNSVVAAAIVCMLAVALAAQRRGESRQASCERPINIRHPAFQVGLGNDNIVWIQEELDIRRSDCPRHCPRPCTNGYPASHASH
jgi:hypothetical protein